MSTNRLAREKSPYLLQHAHNPVDWYPWGAEAFAKARNEQKPIFLSVGYSTCHWCHVMERESFENESIAAILNRYFVSIKVDREERPDVDRIYMTFVQASTGSGGWPMSVFLTPALKPFFGGTYFPPDNRYGRPGFPAILERVAQAWNSQREELMESAEQVVEQLSADLEARTESGAGLDATVADSCYYSLRRSFDTQHGGFGGAPKFPRPVALNFLLRYWRRTGNLEARDMAVETLRAMARGGIHDHLGGGFHRYSVDERWFVPHFEKMLYDQAQLAISYLEAFQITGDKAYEHVAQGIFEYVLRDLRDPEGGFYSAEDADSAPDASLPQVKSEGAFYLWAYAEIEHLLGPGDAARFARWYGVESGGNVASDPHNEFRGRNILFEAETPPPEAAAMRTRLLEARSRRPHPHLDDKILTAWNGLMISAFAKGGAVLGEPRYLEAARQAAEFVLARLRDAGTGVLLRRYRESEAAIPGVLDDYAFLAQALLDIYEAGFDLNRLETAVRLTERAVELFEDKAAGGFYSTAEGEDDLILRVKDSYDGAEPSGNSIMASNLLRLAEVTGREDFRAAAERTFRTIGGQVSEAPVGSPQLLAAYEFTMARRQQIVIVGDRSLPQTRALIREAHRRFLPWSVVLQVDNETSRDVLAQWQPAVAQMRAEGAAAAHVCEDYACQLPVSDPAALGELLK